MTSPREHRRELLQRLAATRTAGFVPTASPKVRNHDADYRFRPDSDFYYLTGFAEPGAALVLLPDVEGGSNHRSVLFLRERDAERELWDGRRLGVDAAVEALGVDEARPIEALWSDLGPLLRGYERVMARVGSDEARDRRLLDVLAGLRRTARGGVRAPVELIDPAPTLHEQRLKKDASELERMRRAAAISTEAHVAAMAAATPGMVEREVEALVEYTFRRRGATGAAYTTIVAGGDNACILHYVENDAPLRDGDLLLIDAGAEFDYYASDVTRTFPVNGRFSREQRELYDVVLAAQLASIDAVRPGATMDAVHDAAVRVLADGLARLGLCQGSGAEVLERGDWRAFYPHRTSHWLGLDVHDCGATHVDGAPRALEPGMILTVEPGLYVPPHAQVEPRWRGIGIRIEDDVLVGPAGAEVLTPDVPKTAADVEAACAARA